MENLSKELQNKALVAKFMGAKIIHAYSTTKDQSGYLVDYERKENYPDNERYHPLNSLKYDTSWDWLMPVVRKIEKLEVNGEILKHSNKVCGLPIYTEISTVYNAVSIFIWYCDQNE